jgi:hypothetical protein
MSQERIKDLLTQLQQELSQTTEVDAETLAQVFGLDRIVVLNSIYNSGVEGGTAAYAFQGEKDAALLVLVPGVAGLPTPSAGFTCVSSEMGNDMGIEFKQYRDEVHESDVYEAGVWFDQKITGSDLGYFVADSVD